jgi:rod shape determining protein RodA
MARASKGINYRFDWISFALLFCLLIIGWLMQVSASANPTDVVGEASYNFLNKHLYWVLFSLLVFLLMMFIEPHIWNTFSYVIYGVSLVLLLGVLIFGLEIKGARSWYSVFGLSFQPAEFAKFGTTLALASLLGYFKNGLREGKNILSALAILLAPMFLILLQPDAGSALVFMSFFILFFKEGLSPLYYIIAFLLLAIFIFSIIFGAKLVIFGVLLIQLFFFISFFPKKLIPLLAVVVWALISYFLIQANHFYWVLGTTIIGGIALSFFMWSFRKHQYIAATWSVVVFSCLLSIGSSYFVNQLLKPHQQDRINVWLRPHLCDPQGSLYNLKFSKMAIGSGGFEGKGFLDGNLTKLNYVPEQSSDFVFSIIGEEQGFIGVISVILIFMVLLYRTIVIGERSKSNFTKRYAYGLAGIVFIHFFVNIGMTMGLMPVVGIPLPFLSSGGSAILNFMLMYGILLKMDLGR